MIGTGESACHLRILTASCSEGPYRSLCVLCYRANQNYRIWTRPQKHVADSRLFPRRTQREVVLFVIGRLLAVVEDNHVQITRRIGREKHRYSPKPSCLPIIEMGPFGVPSPSGIGYERGFTRLVSLVGPLKNVSRFLLLLITLERLALYKTVRREHIFCVTREYGGEV